MPSEAGYDGGVLQQAIWFAAIALGVWALYTTLVVAAPEKARFDREGVYHQGTARPWKPWLLMWAGCGVLLLVGWLV
jgi:hypothetical protein